jgi:hypothetical protein
MSDGAQHPDSKALMGCWQALNNREEMSVGGDNSALNARGLVNRMFLLQRTDAAHSVFRLAGVAVTSLFGRDLREHDFSSLWVEAHRGLARGLVESALSAPGPACVRALGRTVTGRTQSLEIVLLPLVDDEKRPARLLGLIQPLGRRPAAAQPFVSLQATAVFPALPPEPARRGLRLVSSRD